MLACAACVRRVLPAVRVYRPRASTALESRCQLYLAVWFVLFFSFGTKYAAAIPTQGRRPLAAADAAAVATGSSQSAISIEISSTGRGASGTAGATCGEGATLAAAPAPHGAGDGTAQEPLHGSGLRARGGRAVTSLWGASRRVNSAVYLMALSVAIGCTPPLHAALGELGALNWLGSAWHSLGMCGIVISTVLLGAGLWNARGGAKRSRRQIEPSATASSHELTCSDDATAAAAVASAAATGTINHCAISHPQARCAGGRTAFLTAALLLRLVALPALCLPLHLYLARLRLLPDDPTLLMILTVSAGTPSAQTLVRACPIWLCPRPASAAARCSG